MPPPEGFIGTIHDAVGALSDTNVPAQDEIDYWLRRIRRAAEARIGPDSDFLRLMRERFGARFEKLVDRGGVARFVPGVTRFTIASVRPALRNELDRRIRASADLIKLRRAEAIADTLARFQGWASSIPPSGLAGSERRKTATRVAEPTAKLKFEQRRVGIDQGHKLVANVADIVARGNGAIAGIWHSHWRQPGYDYRQDHKERDLKVYAIRGSWAIDAGLMKRGDAGYLDEITQAGEEPFCQCFVQYVSTLRGLPEDMLTEKGKAALDKRAAA